MVVVGAAQLAFLGQRYSIAVFVLVEDLWLVPGVRVEVIGEQTVPLERTEGIRVLKPRLWCCGALKCDVLPLFLHGIVALEVTSVSGPAPDVDIPVVDGVRPCADRSCSIGDLLTELDLVRFEIVPV